MSTMNTKGKLVQGAGGKKLSCIAGGFFTSWAPYIHTPSTKQIKSYFEIFEWEDELPNQNILTEYNIIFNI